MSPHVKKKKVIGKVALDPSASEQSRTLIPKDYIPNDPKSCRELVLKLLSPYFNAGKFADKMHFKELAKKITESLVKVNLRFLAKEIIYEPRWMQRPSTSRIQKILPNSRSKEP